MGEVTNLASGGVALAHMRGDEVTNLASGGVALAHMRGGEVTNLASGGVGLVPPEMSIYFRALL